MAKKRKQGLKIIMIIFLAFLLVFAGVSTFLYYKTESYINKNLSGIIDEKSDGLYDFSFNKFTLDIKSFSVLFTDVSLHFNEKKSKEILQSNPGQVFYHFDAKEVEVSKIRAMSWLKNKHIIFEELIVEAPDIEVIGINGLERNSKETFTDFFTEIRPLFKKHIKKIDIEQITFINANYKLFGNMGDSLQVSNANRISLIVQKFKTDSALIYGQKEFFKSENVLVQMNQLKYILSDSLHEITIDTLEYSLYAADIFARGFHLKHNHKNTSRNLYAVYVPEFYMKSENITRFEIGDSLLIQYLEFERPQIQFFQKVREKQLSVEDISKFNLYRLIEDQFRRISVDTFLFNNASLEIFNQPNETSYRQSFENLNVVLHGFELDSASSQNREKLLHANELEMDVSNYHLIMEDNLHDFRADSMYFSTLKNILGIRNINISPASGNTNKSRTLARIDCEGISINDVNLTTLYHTRRLPTTSIEVEKPSVNIEYHREIAKETKSGEPGLFFQLVSAYLEGVYAKEVNVNQGVLYISNRENDKEVGYFETNFNFNLSGFSLDSASIERTDRFFYASNFDLSFSDYQMKLMDDLHKFSVEEVLFKSFERKVDIKNLHLEPAVKNSDVEVMKKYQRSELFDIFVPNISMWGVDLRKAFFYKQVNISRFQISSPKIYFENFGVIRENRKTKEFSELYDILFKYIVDFDIKQIIVPRGNMNWINHAKNEKTTTFDNDFSITLENFRLNQNELNKKRLLFSDNFDLSIKDQTFQLSDSVHILRAGEINLSTKNSSITIKNGLLYPVITTPKFKTMNTTFQVSIPSLHVRDFNFTEAYYSRKIKISSLDLNAPNFKVYSKPNVSKSLNFSKYMLPFPSFIQSLHLGQFRINNGEFITYHTDGIYTNALSSFKADLILPNVLLRNNVENKVEIESDNLLLQLSDFATPLENSHTLNIDAVKFNRSKKSVLLEGFRLNPIRSLVQGNLFTYYSPLIKFDGFEYEDALLNNDLKFSTINLVNPQISIEINDTVKGDKLEAAQNLDLYPFVKPYVNSILIDKLSLYNTDLQFNWFKKQIINKKINFSFNEIKIAENSPPGNLLNSKEFEISVADLRRKSKNNLYEFSVDSLIYNSKKHKVRLKRFNITPLIKAEEFPRQTGFQTDVVRSETSFIEIMGIDESKWLTENILEAENLRIGPTRTDIFRNKRYPFNHAQRPPWPQDLIKDIKQDFIFHSFTLLPSEINYSELTEIADNPARLKFENLTLAGSQISNIASETEKNSELIVQASSKVFGNNILKADFTFNISENDYYHSISGSLGKMKLSEINPVLEKSAPVKINAGNLNRFDFSIDFNENIAEGELFFAYDNLDISLLTYENNKSRVSKLASFWANKMVINRQNPKGDDFNPAKIYYQRDRERSVLNYWWKSIFSGAKATLGLEDNEVH